ncbi:hypothetical protein BRARA_H00228 [Brassica rapa]|uniref:Transmembrane protein n=1 Tax=Brassica campestris TaxID=3711 RepID=A0A397Y847_BRACM|nr:hypothetical protein BRARA_H00228 [Brassica rapa]
MPWRGGSLVAAIEQSMTTNSTRRSRHRAEHSGEELKKTIRGRDEPYLFRGFLFFSLLFLLFFSFLIKYKSITKY